MSEGASNQAGPSNPRTVPATPRAIASLAKKPTDVTRGGAQKLKFVPTLPARRKKEEVKQEPPTPAAPTTTDRGRGRGRGDGRGRGRGDGAGRGAAPPRPPPVEMTASGPFAMGPAMAGAAGRRIVPRSNFAPIMPGGMSRGDLGAGLTNTTAPTIGVKREPNDLAIKSEGKLPQDEDEGEVYSDNDEGVEIVDMEHVKGLDWMAPESLKKEKGKSKTKKKEKKEEVDRKGKAVVQLDNQTTPETESRDEADDGRVNMANALNLSDSEEEEELEDIIEDFTASVNMEVDEGIRQEQLYFFQFPSPFPKFTSPSAPKPENAPEDPADATAAGAKKVTFAPDAKPPAPGAPSQPGARPPLPPGKKEEEPEELVDGLIGQLEVYASGAVKMRLANGILLDVTAATQPSFLQHAMYVDPANKRMCVLGEVNKRFVVSPDVDALLESIARGEQEKAALVDLEGLISMDTT